VKYLIIISVITFLFVINLNAQGFNVKAAGEKTFNFGGSGSQAKFFSTTPLEDVTGISNEVEGTATFDLSDLRTLKGKITLQTASIKTGIDLRDEHLRSANWMNAKAYPEISFVIKSVSDVQQLEPNKLQASVTGDFTAHGVTKEVVADAILTYLDESEETKKRAPGDLLGVETKFVINLSEFNISNVALGVRVAETVEVSATLIGSSAK
jgi:polyisoprenoid-binding protein YceI